MYTNYFLQEGKIRSILESFTWKGKSSQEHPAPKKEGKSG
jgi:hypothetical protein